jgi:hypothetical protein
VGHDPAQHAAFLEQGVASTSGALPSDDENEAVVAGAGAAQEGDERPVRLVCRRP